MNKESLGRKIKNLLLHVPFSVKTYLLFKKIYNFPRFVLGYFLFKKSDHLQRFSVGVFNWFPCLTDKTNTTPFEPHYTFHPAWAARIVQKNNPNYHVDISSTLYFCTIISAFVPVRFYDYRPAKLNLSGLLSESADLLKLPFGTGSVESLSCMHVVEHIGLGRYGDKIDPEGDLKAIGELKRVVSVGGSLLIVVPVGRPKIAFNAHRIYSYEQIIQCFKGFELVDFSLIPDNFKETGIISGADPRLVSDQAWGCGCFWFKKVSPDV